MQGLDSDKPMPNFTKPKPKDLKRFMRDYSHMSQCANDNCSSNRCTYLKKVMLHTTVCNLRVAGNCPVCVKTFVMLIHHAKYCNAQNCELSVCSFIKDKMKNKIRDREASMEYQSNSNM